jgi:hypothetical protein
MAGLVLGIDNFFTVKTWPRKTWMAGLNPAMTITG